MAKGIFANRTAKVTERPNFVAVATLANSVRQWVNRQAINVFQSWEENIRQYQKGIETLAIVAIPQWWVSGFITFGLLLSSLYVLRYASPSHRVSTHATSPVAEP